MSKVIYKYDFEGGLGQLWQLEEKGLKEIIHFGVDYRGKYCVWGEVDLDDQWTYKINIKVVGTGIEFDYGSDWTERLLHVNSLVTDDGFVWHCYAGNALL